MRTRYCRVLADGIGQPLQDFLAKRLNRRRAWFGTRSIGVDNEWLFGHSAYPCS
ncbi:hypothetical protein [Devosia sp. DBB001]|nr:hypothetical protein [Devosia sp. DBB001]